MLGLSVKARRAPVPRLPRNTACLSLMLAFTVVGCQQATRPNVAESTPRPPRQPGYVAEQRYATTTIHDRWTLGDEPIEVTLLRPPGSGPYPLVIYLPGLGESSNAGIAWRQAWAQAGYAVLAYQPVANAETIWTTAPARRGDFSELAKEQFSQAALDKRLAMLRELFAELERRRNSGALAGVDTSRVALTGFELGAQTTMAAAGESANGTEPFALPSSVKCVIAFSPYADFAGAGFEQRFAPIHVSVLSVTSMEDTDPYGLVTVPAIRRAPFDHMPPGQKYLLSLVAAPHALIAGKETPGADSSTSAQADSPRSQSSDGTNQGSGTGRHRGGGSGAQGRRRGGGNEPGRANPSSSHSPSPAAWTAELGQAQSVTTAYLDANLKSDVVASEWLTKDARRWLGDEADLLVK